MKAPAKYICILFLLHPFYLYGQFIKEIQIGQSSDNTFTKGEPAQFIATYPETTNDSIKNTIAVNGFVSIGLIEARNLSLSVTGEWQKNTLIEKEQDVRQYGIDAQFIIQLKKDNSGDIMPINIWDLYTTLSVKSNDDRVKEEKGVVAVLGFYTDFPKDWQRKLNFFRPGRYHPAQGTPLSLWLQTKHTHNIGLDYLSAHKLLMTNLSFNLELYPFSGYLYEIFKKYNIIQVKGAVVQRDKITSKDSDIDAGTYLTYGLAFNYNFDDDGKQAISIGYDVIDGANPMKGLENQKYAQLALKLKLKI